MRAALAVMRKDLSLMLREPHALVFALGFPLLFGVFFGAVFADSSRERLSVACIVIDRDGSTASGAFLLALEREESISVRTGGSSEIAHDAVARGDVPAAVVLEEDFEERIAEVNRQEAPITLLVDPSQSGAAALVEGIVSGEASLFRAKLIARGLGGDAGDRLLTAVLDAELVRLKPVVPSSHPVNAYELSFSQAMVWAIMGCSAAFGVSLVRERSAGTLTRLRLAPGGLGAALIGKAAACATVSYVAAAGFAVLGVLVFDVSPERPGMLALTTALAAAAFSGVMMIVAVAARNHHSPGQVAWGVLLLFALTGGGMLPLAFMPPWLSSLSYASPVRWAVLAIEAGVWRDLSWLDVLGPMGVLLGIAAATLTLGVSFFQRERSTG